MLHERIHISQPFWRLLLRKEQECSDVVLALQRLSSSKPHAKALKKQLADARTELASVCRVLNGDRPVAPDLRQWISEHMVYLPDTTAQWVREWMADMPDYTTTARNSTNSAAGGWKE